MCKCKWRNFDVLFAINLGFVIVFFIFLVQLFLLRVTMFLNVVVCLIVSLCTQR